MKRNTALWILLFILACYPTVFFLYQVWYQKGSPTAIIYIIDSATQSTLAVHNKNTAIEIKYSELLAALAQLKKIELKK